MGLKITSEIATSAGMTSEAYLNIESVSYKKGKNIAGLPGMDSDSVSIKVNLYIDQDSRNDKPGKTVVSNSIPRYFGLSDQGSPSSISELKGDANMFEVGYTQITQYLQDVGLTVEDEI